jgi:hypothetical protein
MLLKNKEEINDGLKLWKIRSSSLISKKYILMLNNKINIYYITKAIKIAFIIFYFFLLFLPKFLKSNITNHVFSDNIDCINVKNKLNNRTQPFDYFNEFLFFTDLISCKIPFSFIRFADGEYSIMKGAEINAPDKWHWDTKNQKFKDSLIEAVSICTNPNSFIAIPCKNWLKVSESIVSLSKCSSAKYMSYSTLFVNKNYHYFKDWILRFINTSFQNRWKIILVANSIIHKRIKWAYKFFPVPNHIVENWDYFSISLLSKLSEQAKQNNLIFFVSAGPAANIIISYLSKINNNNIYIDLGSSIEFITKGYSTRPYAIDGTENSNHICESFFVKNKTLIYI